MDQGTAPDSAMWSLRSRGPAHAASHTCLAAQSAAHPRRLITRIAGADPLHPDAEVWYRRALAERRVGRVLADLGPEYRVLHALPHGSGDGGDDDIDHLVIGPPGVFTVTTASHPRQRVEVGGDAVHVDGQRTPYLATAGREARTAARALSRAAGAPVTVTPLVVVVGSRVTPTPSPPAESADRVTVIDDDSLPAFLRGRSVVLGPDVVASVARAAEEWTTWRPLTTEPGAPKDPEPEFTRLQRDVEGAHRIRVLWFVGSLAAITVVAFGAASGLFS